MTNDYKANVLKYITNNVTETSGSNVPLFTDNETLNISVSDQIKTALGENYVYGGYLYDQVTQNILIYGYTDTSGFIYIMDKNLTEVSVITEWISGTKLFKLIDLQVDENGYLYGISNDDDVKRVLLLNNVFAKAPNGQYQARLRQSYIIPNYNNYSFQTNTVYWSQNNKKILKVNGEATYYMPLTNKTTNLGEILRFTINVGADNEWIFTNVGINMYGVDMLIDNTGENEILYLYFGDLTTYTNNLLIYQLTNDTLTQLDNVNVGIEPELIMAKSTNEIYVGGIDTDYTYGSLLKFSNGELKTIETFTTSDTLNLYLSNNILCMKLGTSASTKIGILQNDVPYYSSTFTVPTTIVTFFVMLSYNLLIIYLATGTSPNIKTTKFTLDYNPLNYNGLAYSGYNQTLATKGRLYSNGDLVFARNLYNTTLLGNIATSNLQVPNTLLNNQSIVIQDLVGATNGIILHNTTAITKNIYETLYVNFIRSLNVIDEDTNTTYPETASYINLNVNTATQQNCEESFIGKVQINYENSSIIQNICWTYVTDHYETSFVIDATQEVPTISYMSNDETTLYLTKELDINTGNYYKISQKLRIE